MSKMSELSMLLDDLISCGEKLTETAKSLKDFYSSEETPAAAPTKTRKSVTKAETTTEPEVSASEPVAEQPDLAPKKAIKKEDIRAMLAAKANEADGAYKAQVKALVQKYGNGGSLTDVDPSDYAALAAEVEEIGNAG